MRAVIGETYGGGYVDICGEEPGGGLGNVTVDGNLITIAPNYLAHLDILCQAKVSHIVFAGSIPRESEVAQAKASGARVLCFASTDSSIRARVPASRIQPSRPATLSAATR